MTKIAKTAFGSVLTIGTAGFPVGVIGLNKKEQIKTIKENIQATNDEISEEKNREENTTQEIENNEKTNEGLEEEIKLTSEKKWIVKKAKDLNKMLKLGFFSCKDNPQYALKQKITWKEENKEEEIEYCYYFDCDKKLFPDVVFDEQDKDDLDTKWKFLNMKFGCSSIDIKKTEEKLEGNITVSSHGTNSGVVLRSKFSFSSNKTKTFDNYIYYLEKDSASKWTVQAQKKWIDSKKDEYNYDDLKQKFYNKPEHKEISEWNYDLVIKKTHLKILNKVESKILQIIFYKGADLWLLKENENCDKFDNLNNPEKAKDFLKNFCSSNKVIQIY